LNRWNLNRWNLPLAPGAKTDYVEDEVVEVTSEFAMSAESLESMKASPKRAVKGLTSGIAEGLGVDDELVTITRTVPDLLGPVSLRQLSSERRTSDETVSLIVDFEVEVGQTENPAALVASLDKIAEGDTAIAESLTSAVTGGLAAQKIEVEITGVTASVATPAPETPVTTGEPGGSVDSSRAADVFGLGIFMALALQATALSSEWACEQSAVGRLESEKTICLDNLLAPFVDLG
jgi:hypothetical protein